MQLVQEFAKLHKLPVIREGKILSSLELIPFDHLTNVPDQNVRALTPEEHVSRFLATIDGYPVEVQNHMIAVFVKEHGENRELKLKKAAEEKEKWTLEHDKALQSKDQFAAICSGDFERLNIKI